MVQNDFWKGEFGDEYTKRNVHLAENNFIMFNKIFDVVSGIDSVAEYGAGSGMNIEALKIVFPKAKFSAIEINHSACEELRKINHLMVYETPINGDIKLIDQDLVLTKGVLIHIPPEELDKTYKTLYDAANKYILICEYYNPSPVELIYRGNTGKMWKRDFAGDLLDKFSDLKLVNYGFCYHRDQFPQDDICWFLLKKA